MNNILTMDQIKEKAPSVFAPAPWEKQSDNYRFIPTSKIVEAMQDANFFPVKASQSNSRIPGKRECTKHMLRFRPAGDYQVDDIVPEIVLINSHDGTSAYKMMLGMFRLVCSNGLVVADAMISEIRVRHQGARDLCQDVIQASSSIISQAPAVINRVRQWRDIELSNEEQTIFARSALSLNESSIAIEPWQLLQARRREDSTVNGLSASGHRSLWKTFNVIQENMIKGGNRGRTITGRRNTTRAIKAVDRDVKLNKALWELTEKMAELKSGPEQMSAPAII